MKPGDIVTLKTSCRTKIDLAKTGRNHGLSAQWFIGREGLEANVINIFRDFAIINFIGEGLVWTVDLVDLEQLYSV